MGWSEIEVARKDVIDEKQKKIVFFLLLEWEMSHGLSVNCPFVQTKCIFCKIYGRKKKYVGTEILNRIYFCAYRSSHST